MGNKFNYLKYLKKINFFKNVLKQIGSLPLISMNGGNDALVHAPTRGSVCLLKKNRDAHLLSGPCRLFPQQSQVLHIMRVQVPLL